MEKQVRLDKYLADSNLGSRSQVKKDIKQGLVKINGQIVKKCEEKIDIKKDRVFYKGSPVSYQKYVYYMFHKPAGVVTATEDKSQKTVMDFFDKKIRKNLFPVGRLDKDTEGLLLITNDGQLAHDLLSPTKHVDKTYYAEISGKVDEGDAEAFLRGLQVDKDFRAKPAKLVIKESGELSKVFISIEEGKFHQIKRMFLAVGKEVVYLKRISMGALSLDDDLDKGEYRPLREEEIKSLKK